MDRPSTPCGCDSPDERPATSKQRPLPCFHGYGAENRWLPVQQRCDWKSTSAERTATTQCWLWRHDTNSPSPAEPCVDHAMIASFMTIVHSASFSYIQPPSQHSSSWTFSPSIFFSEDFFSFLLLLRNRIYSEVLRCMSYKCMPLILFIFQWVLIKVEHHLFGIHFYRKFLLK